MLLVIVAIVIASMVAGSLAQMAIAQHRQIRLEQDRAQAFWLVASGVDRALARLDRDPQYAGEEWGVDVAGASSTRRGTIVIRVTSDDINTQRRRLEVVAEFPADTVHRARLRRKLAWTAAAQTAQTQSQPASAIFPENVVP